MRLYGAYCPATLLVDHHAIRIIMIAIVSIKGDNINWVRPPASTVAVTRVMVASVRVTLARMWWRRATGTAAGAWANIKQMDVIGSAFLPAKEH